MEESPALSSFIEGHLAHALCGHRFDAFVLSLLFQEQQMGTHALFGLHPLAANRSCAGGRCRGICGEIPTDKSTLTLSH